MRRIKLVASDQGRYEREVMVPSVVIAPGERYVVDVLFDKPGTVAVVNEVQTVDHFLGEIFPNVDTLGYVTVAGRAARWRSGRVHDASRRLCGRRRHRAVSQSVRQSAG